MTKQEELFAAEYLRHFNASRAARNAGYQGKHVARQAYGLLRKPEIATRIAEAIEARLNELDTDSKRVVRQWLLIATADPNELMQTRRDSCRYCHGKDGNYQRTQREMERDREAHAEQVRAREASPLLLTGDLPPIEPFDELGGIGFDPTVEPNAKCIECFGEGVLNVHVTDSRLLSPSGRALFAGIKQTKDGIEVKTHDQTKAWELIAKHLGMLTEKIEVKGDVTLMERLARGRAQSRARDQDDGTDLAG